MPHRAKGTVARAYELLEQAAVVESKGHRGTFVRPLHEVGDPALARVGLAEAAEAFVVAARQYGADLDTARAALDAAWHRL